MKGANGVETIQKIYMAFRRRDIAWRGVLVGRTDVESTNGCGHGTGVATANGGTNGVLGGVFLHRSVLRAV